MTTRGMLKCEHVDVTHGRYALCNGLADVWDEPPSKSKETPKFWCYAHFRHHGYMTVLGWERFFFTQSIVELEDGTEIWYPRFFIDDQFIGWPLPEKEEKPSLLGRIVEWWKRGNYSR